MINNFLSKIDSFLWVILIVTVIVVWVKLYTHFGENNIELFYTIALSFCVSIVSYFFYFFIFVVLGDYVISQFQAKGNSNDFLKLACDLFAAFICFSWLLYGIGIFVNPLSEPLFGRIVIHYSPICVSLYFASRQLRKKLSSIEE